MGLYYGKFSFFAYIDRSFVDLKLKDVAELLNVSDATVLRWVSEGKIPYYRLKQQFLFNRSEVENWVLGWKQCLNHEDDIFSNDQSEEHQERLGTQQYGLLRAIYHGEVLCNIAGDSKEEVIRSSMKILAKELRLDEEVITELLLDRERLMPTAISNGIAVPHTRDFLLRESYDVIAVVFPKNPIEYGALDNQPVHTLFFLFACDDKRHLHLLAKLAHLSRKEEHIEFFKTKPSKEQLLTLIKSWEGSLRQSQHPLSYSMPG